MRCRIVAKALLGCALLMASAVSASAAVKLPAVIGSGMVLQRGQPVPIWGWADKGEEVTVGFAGQSVAAKADAEGRWKVSLSKMEAGGPFEMTIRGSSGGSVTLNDILVGEVWVASGQSNMEMGIGSCNNAQAEIAAANYPKIRLFSVEKAKAAQPATDVKGAWAACTPKNIVAGGGAGFSAAAYYFGRHLHKELNVPVGLINTSWGGTPAESWTSRKALESNPVLKSLAQGEASCLYNGMIAPLVPYGIRGAIWYQGEANVGAAYRYRTLLPAMIAGWRADWGQGDFPFGIVQIAPFGYYDAWKVNPAACAELWEAESMTAKSTPNTGLAVTVDIADNAYIHPKNGDYQGIHPKNKQEVGRRLGLWALAQVYGRSLVYSGPVYKSMTIENDKLRLRFDHVGGGLKTSDGKPLDYFTIAGADQKFVPAVAEIDGDSVVVSSKQVAKPVAVRFAWREDATPNFCNQEGLPTSPFRTDRWKGVTE
jgi:sialate O-acetylesterase